MTNKERAAVREWIRVKQELAEEDQSVGPDGDRWTNNRVVFALLNGEKHETTTAVLDKYGYWLPLLT